MKIGIGISSYKRPEHLELCLRQIFKHLPAPHPCIDFTEYSYLTTGAEYRIFIAKDIPNIAKAKNECLYNLRDCDHIFLFDEDCFPVKDGWVEFFVSECSKWKIPHVLYLTDRHKLVGTFGFAQEYTDCGGCFMYIPKETFNRVGYFNAEYKQYGFEHAAWSRRACNKYLSLTNTKDYLYSLDYQGEGNWGVKHVPSITDYKAMQESIDYNRKVFEKEINGDKIYYEYEPK